MERFIAKHREIVTGTLSCFDRIIFKGLLPLNYPAAMERLLGNLNLKFKDLKAFVVKQATRLKEHARQTASTAGRPYVYFETKINKEEQARAIAERDGIRNGLVCIFSCIEPCRTFRILFSKHGPRLCNARRKCLSIYYYFVHSELGLLHVRIQTWFPLAIQVYVNGHEWLARQMERQHLSYERVDNAFVSLGDAAYVQSIADSYVQLDWPALLQPLAQRVNPLLGEMFSSDAYYWTIHQAEYSTNVMFRDRLALRDLYQRLLRHATLEFGAEDVLLFLGKKLKDAFAGEVVNRYKKRWPGARVKHWIKENWIKVYDKHGSILRVETVINNPTPFRVRRPGIRKGIPVTAWLPLTRGVAYMFRYAEVSRVANHRYLDALAVVDNPTPAYRALEQLAEPRHVQGRSTKPFNPVAKADLRLFAAVLQGQHAIQGLQNRDVRERLHPSAIAPPDQRRCAARVGRQLKRLHLRGLIAKIPRSRRWRVTDVGYSLMSAAIRLHHDGFPEALTKAA